jgi:hypothetical protein
MVERVMSDAQAVLSRNNSINMNHSVIHNTDTLVFIRRAHFILAIKHLDKTG